jgi:hypothetical protein
VRRIWKAGLEQLVLSPLASGRPRALHPPVLGIVEHAADGFFRKTRGGPESFARPARSLRQADAHDPGIGAAPGPASTAWAMRCPCARLVHGYQVRRDFLVDGLGVRLSTCESWTGCLRQLSGSARRRSMWARSAAVARTRFSGGAVAGCSIPSLISTSKGSPPTASAAAARRSARRPRRRRFFLPRLFTGAASSQGRLRRHGLR